ncbi:general secretion pathway protein GspB [uncultured Paraglaciecola sp.]|uniref:general secretion pathway protein GspB n=1 Tax=uncultured Paraglaciecola sp. TaxID=1765024 RepID=UPI0030D6CD79|tara:strand:+ start:108294 stop:109361 length:1068 start_codon:yes stop_codon:yes gene_type:complete
MLKQLNIRNLQPGMVIVRVTEQNGPVKIKKSGLVTSQDMVQGLIEMGIQQVEVDLDQTVEVEVEAPKIKKSTTRRMLESNKVTHARPQDDLPDQFHRNLYLPSVQDIPSPWQFYTKRYVLAVFIVIGGLGFGWTLANYQLLLNLFSSQAEQPPVSVVAPVSTSLGQASKQLDNTLVAATQVDTGQDIKASKEADATEQQIPSQQLTKTATEPSNTEKNDSVKTDIEETDVEQSIAKPIEAEPKISADVLARFKKAMSDVDDSPTAATPVETISSGKNVPRIDQLPPWAMTRLPSMAFSAHMYASIESERWVRVNGIRMVEGDKIDDKVEIVRIEPQHVILNFSGQTFSMAALTDW